MNGGGSHTHTPRISSSYTQHQALVVAPGGMGTLDELFEVLTLKQTGKVQPDLPVVLFGKAYWKAIINWQVCPCSCAPLPMGLGLDRFSIAPIHPIKN